MCVFMCGGGKNDSAGLDVWGLWEQEEQEFSIAVGKENCASTRYVVVCPWQPEFVCMFSSESVYVCAKSMGVCVCVYFTHWECLLMFLGSCKCVRALVKVDHFLCSVCFRPSAKTLHSDWIINIVIHAL